MELEDLTSGQMSLHGKDQGETGKMKTPCRTYREENVFQALREQLCLAIHGRRKTFFGISQVFPEDLGLAALPSSPNNKFSGAGLKNHMGPEEGGVVLTFA